MSGPLKVVGPVSILALLGVALLVMALQMLARAVAPPLVTTDASGYQPPFELTNSVPSEEYIWRAPPPPRRYRMSVQDGEAWYVETLRDGGFSVNDLPCGTFVTWRACR